MIISFQHNYIFIRTKKTASSTIETVLQASLGPDDVVAKRSLDTLPPQLAKMGPGIAERFHAHMTAADIMECVPRDVWDKAFKFTVERHPYERIVSLAYYRMGKKERIRDRGRDIPDDVSEYINRLVTSGRVGTYKYCYVEGKSVLDDVIRQEHLLDDLKRIGARLGIPIPDELPRKKTNFRLDRRPAREILSAKQKDMIYEYFRGEFDDFGYER